MKSKPSARESKAADKKNQNGNGRSHAAGAAPAAAPEASRARGGGDGKSPLPPGQPEIASILLAPKLRSNDATLDKATLLGALIAFKKGDFSARLPIDLEGVDGKIADMFNDVIEFNQRMSQELARLSRVVGKEGKISQRASI